MEHEPASPSQEPVPKKQRTLACQRCRSRKQKCEDRRPCQNCIKGDEDCLPTQPAPRPHIESEYVRILERRVAELESLDPQHSLDHLERPSDRPNQENNPDTSPASSGIRNGGVMGAIASPPFQRTVPPRRSSILSGSSPGYAIAPGLDDEPDLNHLVFGLIASPSAQFSTHDAAISPTNPGPAPAIVNSAHALMATMSPELEEALLDAYRERAQAQYPFFHWDTFLTWHSEWKHCLSCDLKERAWQGLFVNLVYATSLVLLRQPYAAALNAREFYNSGISLLPAVLRQPDRILQVQAYLLLSIHALHQSSTERIISLASTAMRQCVQQQLHLGEMEPPSANVQTRLMIQVRRRCFWCAYLLDRLVMSSFDLPPSIPDYMITVRPFANVEDHDLWETAAITPPSHDLPDSQHYTCNSSALHILQCRRIQSEISAVTLRWDYDTQFENTSDWRIRILTELDNFKSRVKNFSDPQSKGYTSQRWQAMIYHYTLLMLYRPTKANVVGSAGDWLLVQFQSGITLLYCFWATPPEQRTENYFSLDVPDALRACSNILAIMADRWAKAECLRDVFELLAREIPLVDRPNKPPTRLSDKTVTAIQAHLPQVRALVVHRPVLRMIDEMIHEDFPRSIQPSQPPSVAGMLGPTQQESEDHFNSQLQQINANFQMPFAMQQPFEYGMAEPGLHDPDVEGLLSFPGVFDFDGWT
ncbi:unnamed protein product [Alternaria alternata]